MLEEAGWYDNDPDLSEYSQGDVLRSIPFPRWPTYLAANQMEKLAILRPLRSGRLATSPPMHQLPNHYQARAQRDVSDAFSNFEKAEYVVSQCSMRDVLIISRSCSLDNPRRKHIVVAPVRAIRDLPEPERSEGKLKSLRANEIPQSFYLPPTSHMGESIVDLLMMTYMHRSFLADNDVRNQLIARLSPYGTMRLQMQLTEHFGTKFGYDHEDSCPSTGLYSCSACFHAGREISKIEFTKGEVFGHCSVCGDDAKFVKVS
jgi:hypothetical protein